MPQMPLHTWYSKPDNWVVAFCCKGCILQDELVVRHRNILIFFILSNGNASTVATSPFPIYHLAQVVHSRFGRDLIPETL